MPNHKTHIITGFIFVIIATVGLLLFNSIGMGLFKTKEVLFFTVPIVFLYAILPDIDHRSSKITWIFLGAATFMVAVGYLMETIRFLLPAGIILLVGTFIGTRFKHRGITHTILANIILTIPLVFIHWFVALAGFLAYFSHLVIDKELHWK
jgi:membrane-bound metal-dependent hydrolase YbcI (DUF457 family)|tara:strand:- start:7807 stop:8259 length:453 start_codon:yes stop_codon:yes gene_type:complete